MTEQHRKPDDRHLSCTFSDLIYVCINVLLSISTLTSVGMCTSFHVVDLFPCFPISFLEVSVGMVIYYGKVH